MDFIVTPSRLRDARVTVPGDKSISHRALMLGSIATGRTEVTGFLAGEDCLATAAAMRALGVEISQPAPTEMLIEGVGLHGLQAPTHDLDLGNSGTAMRLMAGLLAAQGFDSVLTGDESLQGRPMGRVVTPLTRMGAAIESDCNGTPPLQITGGLSLQGIDYEMPVASAQVKSAVLLAGLYAQGETTVTEPAVTRDHTERMLRAMGASVRTDEFGKGTKVALKGGQVLRGCAIDEFPVLFVAAACAEGETIVEGAEELRVKESDRIAAMADGLRRLGIRVDETPDGAVVHGGRFSGGEVQSFHDHRVAMALAMAATIAEDVVVIRGVDNVNTSFPGFETCVAGLGADVQVA